MPKKVGKTGTYRPSRPRKKHPPPKRSNPDNKSAGPSASRKKLHSSSSEDIFVTLSHYYRIIYFVTVFQEFPKELFAVIVKIKYFSKKVVNVHWN